MSKSTYIVTIADGNSSTVGSFAWAASLASRGDVISVSDALRGANIQTSGASIRTYP